MANAVRTFQWSGIDPHGKRVKGVMQKVEVNDVYAELKKQGIEVISVKLETSTPLLQKKLFSKEKKVSTKESVLFTRYLSTMMASGIPILQALDIVGRDQENMRMWTIINTIKNNTAAGKPLSDSFRLFPECFNLLYCNLISVGEKSGTLDKILARLAVYLEKIEEIKRKLKKALIYPVSILSIAFLVSLVLLLFVVPQFEKMFSSFGAQLPYFTQLVVYFSDFIRAYWWMLVIVFVGIYQILKYLLKHSEAFVMFKDKMVLKIYIIGPVLQKGMIARFARTLSITLEAGLPIVDSMRTMSQIMGNQLYSRGILKISDDIESGRKLSLSMEETGLFPNMVIQMVMVGEESGNLPIMLSKVADYYEEEVSYVVDSLGTLLEPVIMLVLGVILGGFIIAMYLPIFKLGSVF